MNQFDFLYNKEIKKNYKITEQKRLSKNREREKNGAGHKFDLSIKDRIMDRDDCFITGSRYLMSLPIFDLSKSNIMPRTSYVVYVL